jgi:hypothetical protein
MLELLIFLRNATLWLIEDAQIIVPGRSLVSTGTFGVATQNYLGCLLFAGIRTRPIVPFESVGINLGNGSSTPLRPHVPLRSSGSES